MPSLTATFCECRNCGFVLRAENDSSPAPKHWEGCPDCGGTEFAFVDS